MTSTNYAKEWDLRDFGNLASSTELGQALDDGRLKAAAFQTKYQGKIKDHVSTVDGFLTLIKEYETILATIYRPVSFTSLRHSADTQVTENASAKELAQRESSVAQQMLVFFAIELQEVPKSTLEALCRDPKVAPYTYYLEYLLEEKRHTLQKEIEEVLIEKAQTGRRAFVDLVTNFFARTVFDTVRGSDGVERSTFAELVTLREDSDRGVREQAYRAMITPLKEQQYLYGFALNQIVQDCKMEYRRRQFPSTVDAKLFYHHVSRKAFDTLMEVCQDSKDLPGKLFALRGQKLGLQKVRPWDLSAPLIENVPKIDYDAAVATVLDSAQRFSPVFATHIRRIFERRHIDATVRRGKRSGAFCASPYVTEPFVLMSFADDYRSLFTLAHELGHAVHGFLATAAQPILTFHAPLVTCELASIFNEFLLHDAILKSQPTDDVKQYLLLTRAQDVVSTFYRQARISFFESKIHEAAERTPLNGEKIAELWSEHYVPINGAAYEPSDLTPFEWGYIHHIFFEPFYCYNYALSFAVSLACYRRYQDEGEPFVKRYLEALRLGGSRSPEETLAKVGVRLDSRETYEAVAQYLSETLDAI